MRYFVCVCLLLLLAACAKPVTLVTDFQALNNSVEHLRLYVEANKDKLDPKDLAVLEQSYNHWLQVKQTLRALGCDMDITGSICRIDLATIKILHERLLDDYKRIYSIGEKVYPTLDTQGQLIVMQFKTSFEKLDKVLTDFENQPDAEKTTEVVRALSTFATITAKVLPIILSSI